MHRMRKVCTGYYSTVNFIFELKFKLFVLMESIEISFLKHLK